MKLWELRYRDNGMHVNTVTNFLDVIHVPMFLLKILETGLCLRPPGIETKVDPRTLNGLIFKLLKIRK
jgi:hypothetical protein